MSMYEAVTAALRAAKRELKAAGVSATVQIEVTPHDFDAVLASAPIPHPGASPGQGGMLCTGYGDITAPPSSSADSLPVVGCVGLLARAAVRERRPAEARDSHRMVDGGPQREDTPHKKPIEATRPA